MYVFNTTYSAAVLLCLPVHCCCSYRRSIVLPSVSSIHTLIEREVFTHQIFGPYDFVVSLHTVLLVGKNPSEGVTVPVNSVTQLVVCAAHVLCVPRLLVVY